jgi:hypothetical protein
MPSIVAVASVAVIVAAMVAFFAGGSGEEPAPEPQAQNAPRTAEEATPTAEPRAKKAERNAGKADRKAAKKRSADRKRDRRNRPRTEPRDAPDPEVPDVYVEVYNNTTITGLAASTAAELQDGGWQVVGVDNWRGDIPSSTVYYPAGLEDEADQLADTLGFSRVRGAVAPMKFDRLTVILTPDAA